uniref:Mating-type protein MAT-1 n=1 Tax=Didymella tanaceti TaxID=500497 RepID=A0A1I9LKT9_9PLEO|nr:MAT1-1-1 [Didymella tanaceti]ANK36059.1 MAT1-1-1 [Didymella tanaceti]ANK36065.1 MAT1-1-1 [Didymella tanaceti]
MPSKIQTYPMAVPRDPTSAEIAHFLSTRSGDQMMQLVQSIREPTAQAALTASLILVPPTVVTKSAPPEKTRKALNAFVGFRCYYILIPVFKPWPMKKLSNPMGVMWEADPNKSLWSLMTKAWSVIRDQIGKDKAPLDQFFRIICPYLNIPSPEAYLDCCGWTLDADDEDTPSLSRQSTPSPGAMSAGIADMTLSVEDIISYCQSMGYAQEYVSDLNFHSSTFLAQSRNQFAGNSTSSTHESRLAARNKRRAKRQTTRNAGIAPVLQQHISDVHLADDLNVTYQDNSVFDHSEPVQFYDDLADLLNNHMGQTEQVPSFDSAGFVTTADPVMTAWTDWGAFRLGADENATLPSFDPVTL